MRWWIKDILFLLYLRHSCLIFPPKKFLRCLTSFVSMTCPRLSQWIDMAEAAIVYRGYMVLIFRYWPKQPITSYLHQFWNIQFCNMLLVWVIASHYSRPEKISNLEPIAPPKASLHLLQLDHCLTGHDVFFMRYPHIAYCRDMFPSPYVLCNGHVAWILVPRRVQYGSQDILEQKQVENVLR